MPAADFDPEGSPTIDPPTRPFPPVTKRHIYHCSFHSWYSRFRSITPKARVIPLSTPFVEYLRSDGIVLPSDGHSSGTDDNVFSDPALTSTTTTATADDADEEADPSVAWKELHEKIHSTITELDGSVVPKLNWSAPKDATWIAATNSMECQVPNDIYLLLKGSDFITHDLDHAFDDCEDQSHSESQGEVQVESEDRNLSSSGLRAETFPYCLVLRKTIPAMITSLEFRCFVNARHLLCLCQRELNYYEFLTPLVPKLLPLIQTFFDKNLRDTFPDEDFVFDIYIPPPHVRVWLIDINPWAPRTDPLLFSWLEVFEMAEDVKQLTNPESESEDDDENQSSEAEYAGSPEFRLVGRNDPEALNFNTAQYSAHKLPKDVVDAGIEGEAGIRDFMVRWREIVNQERQADTG